MAVWLTDRQRITSPTISACWRSTTSNVVVLYNGHNFTPLTPPRRRGSGPPPNTTCLGVPRSLHLEQDPDPFSRSCTVHPRNGQTDQHTTLRDHRAQHVVPHACIRCKLIIHTWIPWSWAEQTCDRFHPSFCPTAMICRSGLTSCSVGQLLQSERTAARRGQGHPSHCTTQCQSKIRIR